MPDVYLHVFQRTQYEVGRLWQGNQISVAQEHYCSAATQLIMSQLYPHIFGSVKTHGTLVGTCVSGDLHEIGVRILCDFFEMQGWHSHYLGANVPSPSVVETVLQLKADVLAISATITYLVLRSRRELPFHWMMLAFAVFIVACGATHFMEVWTLRAANPPYWLSGWVKLPLIKPLAGVNVSFSPLVPVITNTLLLVNTTLLVRPPFRLPPVNVTVALVSASTRFVGPTAGATYCPPATEVNNANPLV